VSFDLRDRYVQGFFDPVSQHHKNIACTMGSESAYMCKPERASERHSVDVFGGKVSLLKGIGTSESRQHRYHGVSTRGDMPRASIRVDRRPPRLTRLVVGALPQHCSRQGSAVPINRYITRRGKKQASCGFGTTLEIVTGRWSDSQGNENGVLSGQWFYCGHSILFSDQLDMWYLVPPQSNFTVSSPVPSRASRVESWDSLTQLGPPG
jgi:hypothetical protein